MYDLPAKTLNFYLENPLFKKNTFDLAPTNQLAKEINSFIKNNKGMVNPEEDALTFYLLNHGFHLIKNKYGPLEKLPPEVEKVVEMHFHKTQKVAMRLFSYIILVSLEEAVFEQGKPSLKTYLDGAYGGEFVTFFEKIKSRGNSFSNADTFQNMSTSIGSFLNGVTSIFQFGGWSGGFGGVPWAQIIGLARNVATGRESFETMADYAFTLCHNNGSMFNKGKLYNMYSPFIYEILDIQASGQIPQWINENQNNKFVSKDVLDSFNNLKKIFPEEMTKALDKKLIKDSGDKRKAQEAQKLKQLKAAYGGNYAGYNDDDPKAKAPPTQKVDQVLIDTFKNNKWI